MKKALISFLFLPTIALAHHDYDYQDKTNHEQITLNKKYNIQTKINEYGGVRRLKEEADNGDIRALSAIGDMYQHGFYFEQDTKRAEKIYLRAIKNGSNPEAEFGLAVNYLGINTEYDENNLKVRKNKGFEYLLSAATKEHTMAQYILGGLHLEGKYLPQDVDLGLFFLSRAASQGLARAQEKLTAYTEKLTDLQHSYDKAKKDITNGRISGLEVIADYYDKGQLVQQNKEKSERLRFVSELFTNNNSK